MINATIETPAEAIDLRPGVIVTRKAKPADLSDLKPRLKPWKTTYSVQRRGSPRSWRKANAASWATPFLYHSTGHKKASAEWNCIISM